MPPLCPPARALGEPLNAYLWADYIELLCLSPSNGNYVSASSLPSLLKQEDDINDEILKDYRHPDEPDEPDEPPAVVNDQIETDIVSIFALLRERGNRYGANYPFDTDKDSIALKENFDACCAYTFLLLCSNLRTLDRKQSNVFTQGFESFSCYALKGLFPKAEVIGFGASNSRNDSFKSLQGGAYERLYKLAEMIRCDLCAKESDFRQRDSGDVGIDVVAYIPFSDGLSSQPVIFAQCACSEDEEKRRTKALSVTPDALHNFFHFNSPVLPVLCIPQCYKKVPWNWNKGTSPNVVFLDRHRLLQLATQGGFCLGERERASIEDFMGQ